VLTFSATFTYARDHGLDYTVKGNGGKPMPA
jgi:hypothetical protein